jgi:hypothetical protein
MSPLGAAVVRSGVTPQWMIFSFGQWAGSENSIAWDRAKWLMQKTNRAAPSFPEMPAFGVVDLGRTMERVGKPDIRQGGGQHRHIGRTVGEMVVQMVDALICRWRASTVASAK